MSAFPTIQFEAADAVLAFPSSWASADIHLAASNFAGWLRQQLEDIVYLDMLVRREANSKRPAVQPAP
jgi:hypothetical protein